MYIWNNFIERIFYIIQNFDVKAASIGLKKLIKPDGAKKIVDDIIENLKDEDKKWENLFFCRLSCFLRLVKMSVLDSKCLNFGYKDVLKWQTCQYAKCAKISF